MQLHAQQPQPARPEAETSSPLLLPASDSVLCSTRPDFTLGRAGPRLCLPGLWLFGGVQ